MNEQPMNEQPMVRVERHEGWATVVLNRPERKNAITGPLADQLAVAIDELSADTGIAGIVLRGADGAFCSGVDLKELQTVPQLPWVTEFQSSTRRMHIALFNCACPIVVALERYGINAGTSLALAGDFIVAGDNAFLQIGEIHQGAAIPMNAAWLRIKSSEHVLARMALLGDRVNADELLRLHLVHEVVPADEVRARAEEIAARFATFPDQSSRTIKAGMRAHLDLDPESWFTSTANSALLTAAQVRS